MSFNTKIFVGAILGISVGLFLSWLGMEHTHSRTVLYLAGLISGIFVALLKMIMIPLVFTSIAVGVSRLSHHQQIHRVWLTTLVFFLITSTLAVMLGVTGMQIFNPAQGVELAMFREAMQDFDAGKLALPEFFSKFFVNLFVNPFAAMASGNIMAVVVFALFLGIAMVKGGERYRHLQNTLEECFTLMMQMINWIMQLAPLGIMALLIQLAATQNVELFSSLGKFMATIIGLTLFHGVIVLPLLVYGVTKVTPWYLWSKSRGVLLTAFSTSSSSATLPLTLRCLEEDMNVSPDVANFVAPVGAQLNMDGTALYEAAAALFVAALVGVELSLGQQLVVCLMAMIAAIGAPGIPSAGMVTMVMVLQSVGLPAEAIAILLPIDRLLDAFRTAVNVEGDICGSLVVEKISGIKGELK